MEEVNAPKPKKPLSAHFPEGVLETIAKTVHLQIEHIVALYQWGSRLFENEEDDEKSDFDFICVIDDFVPPLPTHNSFGKLKKITADSNWEQINQIRLAHFGSVQTGNYNGKKIDVGIYEESFWSYLVQKHIIWTLSFQFFSNIGVTNKIVFEKRKIQLEIYVLQHATFAIQLAKYGRVTDIFAANSFHREIFSRKVESLEELWDWFIPKKDKLCEELKTICSGYRNFVPNPAFRPYIIQYINQIGLDNIIHNISVHPIIIEQYDSLGVKTSLIQLLCDEEETPYDVDFTLECCGIVLEMIQYENRAPTFQLVAFPFTKVFDHKEDLFYVENSFDWKSCQIFPYRDGQQIALFFYQNRWIVTCYSDFRAYKKFGKIGSEIFWRLWKEKGFQLPGIFVFLFIDKKDDNDKTICFIFQIFSHQLKNVIQQIDEDIEFIGARDSISLQELDVGPFSSKYKWKTPSQIPFKVWKPFRRNIDELYRLALLNPNPLYDAGYLAVDKNRKRMKVQSYVWQYLSNPYGSFEELQRCVLHLIRLPKTEQQEKLMLEYTKMKAKYLQLCKECDDLFSSIMKTHGGSGKEFADEVNKQKNYAILFGIKKFGTASKYLSAADTFPELGIQRRLEQVLFEEEPPQMEFSQNEGEESFV